MRKLNSAAHQRLQRQLYLPSHCLYQARCARFERRDACGGESIRERLRQSACFTTQCTAALRRSLMKQSPHLGGRWSQQASELKHSVCGIVLHQCYHTWDKGLATASSIGESGAYVCASRILQENHGIITPYMRQSAKDQAFVEATRLVTLVLRLTIHLSSRKLRFAGISVYFAAAREKK